MFAFNRLVLTFWNWGIGLISDTRCEVHVIQDAVSSQNKQDRETALNRMKDSGVFITSTESVIFELMRDSKNTNFKAILPLIKVKRERM